MVVTSKLKIDLLNRGATQLVYAVQNDKYCRNIEFSLYSGGVEWIPGDGVNVIVSYKKPDGTGGRYDVLPNGEIAHSISGNALTIMLAPQVLTVPGKVQLSTGLESGNSTLNTFQIVIDVQENPGLEAESDDYYNQVGFVPASGWTPNMYLGTDENGNVIAKQEPSGGNGSGNDNNASSNVLYEYDKDAEYTDTVSVPVEAGLACSRLVKISNDAPEPSYFIGKTLHALYSINGKSDEDNFTLHEDSISEIASGIYGVGPDLFLCTSDSASFDGIVLTKGIWCMDSFYEDESLNPDKFFLYKEQVLANKPIDESLIPDSIARKTDISWKNLPDKPFGEWGEYGTYDLLEMYPEPERQVIVNGYIHHLPTFWTDSKLLEIGAEYTVRINGKVYTDIAIDGGVEGEAYGTTALLGQPQYGVEAVLGTYEINCKQEINPETGESGFSIFGAVRTTDAELTEFTITSNGIKKLHEMYVSSAIARVEDVQTMIDTALGVIENGTY